MKTAIKSITGKVIPMFLDDIDTDIIIPAQHLTQTSRAGYGEHAFARLKQADADFVLNQDRYQNASILVAGDNFGCGSSREHAVWAIQELGIRAVIAPSFADIFSNNAQKNHLPLITADRELCLHLASQATGDNPNITIDLSEQQIHCGTAQWTYHINPFFRHVLTEGLNELDYLMGHQASIQDHHQRATNHRCFLQVPEALT